MAQMTDAELQLLEQFGGSADPQFIPGSSLFGKGDRVTMADGSPITSLAEKSLDSDLGIPQAGGARRSRRRHGRKRLTHRRRSVRGKGRGRYLLNLHLRISSRQRQSRRQRHRS
jgi:hypothetical protein